MTERVYYDALDPGAYVGTDDLDGHRVVVIDIDAAEVDVATACVIADAIIKAADEVASGVRAKVATESRLGSDLFLAAHEAEHGPLPAAAVAQARAALGLANE